MTPQPERATVAHAAWYGAPISEFRAEPVPTILGLLGKASRFDDSLSQRQAWEREVGILQDALLGLDGWIFLEFDIPRLGARIDAVVVTGSALVPIEFKVGEREFQRSHLEQAWDYGLDLKNFHAASHAADVFPLLVATEASESDLGWGPAHLDGVRRPRRANADSLSSALHEARAQAKGMSLDGCAWGAAPYRPTPTIVQAARALYAGHSVAAISRSDAGARNLLVTSRRVEAIVEEARERGEKAIVFVTGVPGAGKTLVGLDIATRRRNPGDATHAVFLSGNGPLVAVLREALTRDELARRKARGERPRKGAIAQPVKAFVQNVHHFRDEGLRDEASPPADRVVIFDEAQRAWDLAQTAAFMRQRKGRPDFTQSEPEVLLSYMDRHPGWAAVICLVGSGQEIHRGEAGIGTWLEALQVRFPTWRVHVSRDLSATGDALDALVDSGRLVAEPDLHLATSMRSFRAEAVSGFVDAVLKGERSQARDLVQRLSGRYPLALTRDLGQARRWLRDRTRGSERAGLVASSKALRLKPHAIDVRVVIDPVRWFLDDADDTRSSSFLEDAATEFQVQGLELDWVCTTWDADLRRASGRWSHHAFRGARWEGVRQAGRRQYLENAYRVLLTRARQGMVIFVPPGDPEDPTRAPSLYAETYDYLAGLGIESIDG